ncbi:hypothetical protein GGR52DRAFT_541952 [Hypoxylon sp. FL1284]|nr:hypothetical protein GGR52DRAFT_541952 [Hypoxylon sp. FL1284]
MDALNFSASIVASSAYLLVPFLLLKVCYRLWLHPLHKYPGPLLGKLSNAYGGYHSLTKRHHLTTLKNHQRYGPVIRQGPNMLIFNSATALQDIYQNPRISKSYAYERSRLAPNPTLFDTMETDQHRLKRKILSQATSERWMRLFEPTMMEQVDIFLRELMASSLQPVNMMSRPKLRPCRKIEWSEGHVTESRCLASSWNQLS